MKSYRNTALLIFTLVIVMHGFAFAGLYHLDKRPGGMDGDPTNSYPIYGQDSPVFAVLGENLIKNHKFSIDGVTPEVFRTPGYPLFLSIFGAGVFAVFIQIIFSGVIALLVWFMARKFLSEKISAISAVIFSLMPLALIHSVTIQSENLFLLFFLSSVFLVFFARERAEEFFLGGLALGLSALIRPISLYLPIVFSVFILLRHFRVAHKASLKYVGCVLVGFLVITFPWFMRNYIETGVLGFSSVSTYNIAEYNMKDFLKSEFGANSAEYVEYSEKFGAIPEARARSLEGGEEVRALYTPILKQHFLSYLKFHLLGTTKFFFSSSLRSIVDSIKIPRVQHFFGLSDDSPDLLSALGHGRFDVALHTLRVQFFITIDRLIALLLVLLAFFSVFIKGQRFYSTLFLTLIFYFALLTGPVSIPRYRLPIEPFIYILAFYSLSHYYPKLVEWMKNKFKEQPSTDVSEG